MSAERQWPDELTVAPIVAAGGSVRLPGSKSLSNRALLLAALARGRTRLNHLLEADDTAVMIDALRRLGVGIEADGADWLVSGCDGRWPVREAALFLGNAGTAMRSLTPALAFSGGRYALDGVARMRERPIKDLVDALCAVGAQVRYLGQAGYPPLQIEPATFSGAQLSVRGDVSSQFLSGLLMAAPLMAPLEGLVISVEGLLISQPYVQMTRAIMRVFGVAVGVLDEGRQFVVPQAAYVSPGTYFVEGDASAASYFLALGAMAGGPVRVLGVGRGSVQGDVQFAKLLQAMGAQLRWGDDWIECSAPAAPLRGGCFNCIDIPDAAMTACVVALLAQGPTRLTGIGSWRVKETDRIAAMAAELQKLGAQVSTGPDWIEVTGPPGGRLREAHIDTYDDHRMAMCFSLAACAQVPVHIREPRCVAKTFPAYFDALAALVTTTPRS